MGVYGTHTQVKCILKTETFGYMQEKLLISRPFCIGSLRKVIDFQTCIYNEPTCKISCE